MPFRQSKDVPAAAPRAKQALSSLNVDTGLIETLAELLQRTGLTEIELSEGDSRLRVVRAPAPVIVGAAQPYAPPAGPPPVQANPAEAAPAREVDHPGALRAPMVGTAYLTPEPGADPFISVGSEVKEGDTLMIIEAMKVMNPIRAPRSGRVTKILISNGDPVEFGELLLIIE